MLSDHNHPDRGEGKETSVLLAISDPLQSHYLRALPHLTLEELYSYLPFFDPLQDPQIGDWVVVTPMRRAALLDPLISRWEGNNDGEKMRVPPFTMNSSSAEEERRKKKSDNNSAWSEKKSFASPFPHRYTLAEYLSVVPPDMTRNLGQERRKEEEEEGSGNGLFTDQNNQAIVEGRESEGTERKVRRMLPYSNNLCCPHLGEGSNCTVDSQEKDRHELPLSDKNSQGKLTGERSEKQQEKNKERNCGSSPSSSSNVQWIDVKSEEEEETEGGKMMMMMMMNDTWEDERKAREEEKRGPFQNTIPLSVPSHSSLPFSSSSADKTRSCTFSSTEETHRTFPRAWRSREEENRRWSEKETIFADHPGSPSFVSSSPCHVYSDSKKFHVGKGEDWTPQRVGGRIKREHEGTTPTVNEAGVKSSSLFSRKGYHSSPPSPLSLPCSSHPPQGVGAAPFYSPLPPPPPSSCPCSLERYPPGGPQLAPLSLMLTALTKRKRRNRRRTGSGEGSEGINVSRQQALLYLHVRLGLLTNTPPIEFGGGTVAIPKEPEQERRRCCLESHSSAKGFPSPPAAGSSSMAKSIRNEVWTLLLPPDRPGCVGRWEGYMRRAWVWLDPPSTALKTDFPAAILREEEVVVPLPPYRPHPYPFGIASIRGGGEFSFEESARRRFDALTREDFQQTLMYQVECMAENGWKEWVGEQQKEWEDRRSARGTSRMETEKSIAESEGVVRSIHNFVSLKENIESKRKENNPKIGDPPPPPPLYPQLALGSSMLDTSFCVLHKKREMPVRVGLGTAFSGGGNRTFIPPPFPSTTLYPRVEDEDSLLVDSKKNISFRISTDQKHSSLQI